MRVPPFLWVYRDTKQNPAMIVIFGGSPKKKRDVDPFLFGIFKGSPKDPLGILGERSEKR